ncbi:hypothetical protein [Arsukibacterium perlucidum]|uniref:hypothetical protein n=1 Tax=Arsukibacterium perlucidum TaxID=368811 RepID=UPI0003704AD8|nr:hypothetical protein [Arsukibacterium perlucidum]
MNTTFKKTLVASALFAFAGAAQAATISAGTEHELTSQYLSSTGANHTMANDFAVTLGAEYVVNDTMTLTFTQPLAAAVTADIIVAAVEGVGAAAKKGVTFSVISGGAIGDSSVTYRLTTVTNTVGGAGNATPGVTSGIVLPLPTFQVLKSNLTGGATVSFSAKTNTGLDLDTSGGTARTRSLAKAVQQFTITSPSIARVIDVNADRKSFVDLDVNNANANDFKVIGTFNIATLTTAGVVYARPINGAAGVKHTLTGDFSWVVDNDTVTTGLQPKAGVFATTGTCANPVWAYSTTAVSLTCDAVAADTAIVIDPEANKAGVAVASQAILPSTTFTATSTVTYTGPAATESVINAASAGAWTLNGSVVRVPYMVMKDGRFGTILNVTNHSSQSANVVFDLFDENGTKLQSNYAAGTAAAGSVHSIAGFVRDALVASGKDVVNSNVKYSLQITTNAPANDVIVYSAYTDQNNGGERAIVNNDSKVQTK